MSELRTTWLELPISSQVRKECGLPGAEEAAGEWLHTLGKGSFSHTETVTILDKKPVLFCFYFSLGRWGTHVTSEASLSVTSLALMGKWLQGSRHFVSHTTR